MISMIAYENNESEQGSVYYKNIFWSLQYAKSVYKLYKNDSIKY